MGVKKKHWTAAHDEWLRRWFPVLGLAECSRKVGWGKNYVHERALKLKLKCPKPEPLVKLETISPTDVQRGLAEVWAERERRQAQGVTLYRRLMGGMGGECSEDEPREPRVYRCHMT